MFGQIPADDLPSVDRVELPEHVVQALADAAKKGKALTEKRGPPKLKRKRVYEISDQKNLPSQPEKLHEEVRPGDKFVSGKNADHRQPPIEQLHRSKELISKLRDMNSELQQRAADHHDDPACRDWAQYADDAERAYTEGLRAYFSFTEGRISGQELAAALEETRRALSGFDMLLTK